MSDLVFKPIIPLTTMIIFSIIMLVIVILNRRHIINRIIILVLLLIISQRPMLRNQEDLVYSLDIDVLFVIDNTVSMNAVDANGTTRLNVVKQNCKYLIDKLAGASYGVITFGNFSQVRMPFSHDASDIEEIINNIKVVDPAYASGSTLELPYDDIKILLESSHSKEDHHRVIFYISDGELTAFEKNKMNLEKFKEISKLVDNGAVFGYGTSNGGKILIDSSIATKYLTDSQGYLLDKTNNPPTSAISKLDEANLKSVASNLKVEYVTMPDNTKLNSIAEEIIAGAQKNRDDTEYSDKDLYYYFSMSLLVFLFLELLYYRRNEQ